MKKLLLFACSVVLGMSAMAQTDVTSTYLTNAGFDTESDWCKENVSANKTVKNVTGFTFNGGSDWYYCASYGVNSGYTHNGATVPATNSNEKAEGGVLGLSVGWGNTCSVKTAEVTLPAGYYTLKYAAYNAGTAAQANNKIGFVTSSKNFFGKKNSFTVSAWTTEEISIELTEETTGYFQVGIEAVSGGSGSNAKLFVDYIQILKDKSPLEKNTEAVAGASATTPVETSFIVNGTFDSNKDGWTSTTGYQNNNLASNQTGAFTGKFWENWNPSAKVGKMYQTVNNIPNGTYKLKICAFVNTLKSEAQYVYANSDKENLIQGEPTAYEVWTVVTDNTIEVGLEQTEAIANWMGIDNVSLVYYGEGNVVAEAKAAEGIDLTAWNEAKAAAETSLANHTDESYATEERAAVVAAKGAADPTSLSDQSLMVAALNSAVAAFESAYTADKLAADKADFVEAYNTMLAKYTESVAVTFNGSCGSANGQHWSGDSRSYADTWNESATTKTNTCTITLPAGEYALVAAGRGQAGTTPSISVKVGEEDATVYNYTAKGDAGVGIALDGSAAYDWRTADKFTNNNLGRGWEWGYIEFALAEETEVTLSYGFNLIDGSWASIADAALLCTAETKDAAALAALAQEIMDLVNATTIPTANIGEGAFQYSQDNIDLVQDQKDLYVEATASDLVAMAQYQYGEGAAAFLEAFKEGVQADIEAMNTLNQPKAGQKFNVVLTYAGWGYDNKAMTYIANGRKDAGNYNIQYLTEVNPNYAQAFTMTWVEGNKYKMSQIDADGVERFISTGIPYGGNTGQIRTTTDAEKALLVEVRATATEGKYNLWNTEANQYIGSQDAGVFTVNSHIDFNIVEAAQVTATISAAGYATFVAPFEVAVPDGAKAYTIAELDGSSLTLTQIEEGPIAANTPVVLEGAEITEEYGYAKSNPTSATVTVGLLTGVYVATVAPADSYVLQKQDKVGFYKVAEGTQPTVGANRAYLTAPTEARVLTFGEETAINAIDALTSGKAQIFDLNGRQLNSLQKGINIVNGVKILVK